MTESPRIVEKAIKFNQFVDSFSFFTCCLPCIRGRFANVPVPLPIFFNFYRSFWFFSMNNMKGSSRIIDKLDICFNMFFILDVNKTVVSHKWPRLNEIVPIACGLVPGAWRILVGRLWRRRDGNAHSHGSILCDFIFFCFPKSTFLQSCKQTQLGRVVARRRPSGWTSCQSSTTKEIRWSAARNGWCDTEWTCVQRKILSQPLTINVSSTQVLVFMFRDAL